MTDIPSYRTAFRDAEGRPFPREGEIRVFLDDDNEVRLAPEGWIHLRTVREVCMLILQERVIELSLDNDLDGDVACGQGYQVIDFLEELHGVEDRPLWPRDGITIHTANPEGRDTMKRAIKSLPGRLPVEVEEVSLGSRPKYLVRVIEPSEASVAPSSGPG
ncbi:MAG: cyclic-phosphate processing receiver domain-containing protein [Solirubrobacterales bacterium]